jgi:hypothetical protein
VIFPVDVREERGYNPECCVRVLQHDSIGGMAGRLCSFDFLDGALVERVEHIAKDLDNLGEVFPEGACGVGWCWTREIGWGPYLGAWLSWNVTILCAKSLEEGEWDARGVRLGERLGMSRTRAVFAKGGLCCLVATEGFNTELQRLGERCDAGAGEHCVRRAWIGSAERMREELRVASLNGQVSVPCVHSGARWSQVPVDGDEARVAGTAAVG